MAKIEEVKDTLVKAQETTQSLQQLIETSAKELGKALPHHMRSERLVRIALTCIRLNPELAQCTPASFLGALFTAAQIGLEPVAGRAYILPFNNKRKIGNEWRTFKEAQFMIGYRGLTDLFFRNEKAVQLSWGVVYSNDEFDFEYGTKEFLRHRPAKTNKGDVVGYYVIGKLQGGGTPFQYMPKIDCLEHGKKHSKTYDKKENKFHESSPWVKDVDAMCLKTVLIQLSKLLPCSMELQRAIATDETAREYRSGGITDMLDISDKTNWADSPVEEQGQTVNLLPQNLEGSTPSPPTTSELMDAAQPITEADVETETKEEIEGEITSITRSPAKGKPHKISMLGMILTTFSDSIVKTAQEAVDGKMRVYVEYETNGKYHNIKTLNRRIKSYVRDWQKEMEEASDSTWLDGLWTEFEATNPNGALTVKMRRIKDRKMSEWKEGK